jgi:hypothetical protein
LNEIRKAAAVAAVVFMALASGASQSAAQTPTDSVIPKPDTTDTLTVAAPTRIGISAPVDSSTQLPIAAGNCALSSSDIALRRVGVGAVFVGGNAALYSYFKRAWWSGEKADHFFFHADWDQDFRD